MGDRVVALVVSFGVLILVWVDVSLVVVVVVRMLLQQRGLSLQEDCELAGAANLFFCCSHHCFASSHHALDDVGGGGGGPHLFFSYGPWLQGRGRK